MSKLNVRVGDKIIRRGPGLLCAFPTADPGEVVRIEVAT